MTIDVPSGRPRLPAFAPLAERALGGQTLSRAEAATVAH